MRFLDDFDKKTISRFNEQIQNQLAIYVINLDYEEEEAHDNQEMIKLFIQLLDFVVKSNSRLNRIPASDFVNEVCSNSLNMKYIAKQYYSQRKNSKDKGQAFVYMNYPWLFSTAAKVEVIQFESRLNMEGNIDDMLNNNGDIF